MSARLLTEANCMNSPFSGGLNAVGLPVSRFMAARFRRSTPPAFMKVPPATTSSPLTAIARVPNGPAWGMGTAGGRAR